MILPFLEIYKKTANAEMFFQRSMIFCLRGRETNKGGAYMDYRNIIQQSIDYIEANLKTEITAMGLAQDAGFSLFHFYRLFQSATGLPVMQFILRRRLLHGIYEIKQGQVRIEVALRYGFDTYAGFYKAFQREFSCTPTEYLKSDRVRRPCRFNLSKEEHMIITRKKTTEILKHWHLEDETITDIYGESSGERNESAFYVGTQYVLKCTANLGEFLVHMKLSKALEELGMCAAVPVKTPDGPEYIQDGELYFVLTKRIEGRTIKASELYGSEGKSKARFMGEILGQMHLALTRIDAVVNDANLYETVKNWALPKAKDSLGLSGGFCEDFVRKFGDLYQKLPKQIIHRDPNPGNIILTEQGWGFIDFDLSERNMRLFDPCYAATAILSESFNKLDDAGLEDWLEIYRNLILGYDSVVKLTTEEKMALPYVILANQFVCVAWIDDREKYPEMFETNKKMTNWLLNHFDELQFLYAIS